VLATCYLVTTRSLLSVVTETSVYLAVAHQRTSISGSTIPAFSRHVTVLSCDRVTRASISPLHPFLIYLCREREIE
jgi:hypothetical protein